MPTIAVTSFLGLPIFRICIRVNRFFPPKSLYCPFLKPALVLCIRKNQKFQKMKVFRETWCVILAYSARYFTTPGM